MKTINHLFTKVYPFLAGILIIAAVLLGKTNARAQSYIDNTEEVKVSFNILINDQKIETNDIRIEIVNVNRETSSKSVVPDSFDTFFKYDRIYLVTISRLGYCKKTIELSTYCPKDNYNLFLNFNLKPNEPDQYMGKLAYNEDIKGFMKYE
jgi:hypothetical protein